MRHPFHSTRRAALLLPLLAFAWCVAPAYGQLRIVDYNIAENYDVSGDPGGLDTVFAAIGAEVINGFAKPIDVLAIQESATNGSDAIALAGILNGVYGVSTYMAAPVPGGAQSSGNGLPGLVYNSATVGLLGTQAFGTVNTSNQARSTLRYQLRPAGYDAAADFFLYNNHYKADDGSSDQARRLIEAQGVRSNADALGEGAHAIYAGDYNIQSSSEDMYQHLLFSGPGQAFDPIATPGSWNNNSSFKLLHTQSPATSQFFSGQVTGGMDDRFDFQLVTGEFLDGEGLSYIPGSYHAFGNNGTHSFNGAITTGSGAASSVLTALSRTSDHLPVVADYQLPAKLGVQVAAIPPSVAIGAAVNVDVMIDNLAAALSALGADELDYTLSVTGDLFGGASGTINPLASGDLRQVTLNTATSGLKSGVITVATSSQGAANALYTLPVNFQVGSGTTTRVTVARDDFDSPLNLISFTQTPASGAFISSLGSGFQVYQAGVSPQIPFGLADESTSTFPSDTQGVINVAAKSDAWFGVIDTVNPDNPGGNAQATWTFDVAGASALQVSIDMGAMGDFEAVADAYNWTYSLDGGAFSPLFTSSVDESASAVYTLADGDMFSLDDPLSMTMIGGQTIQLSNVLQTLTSDVTGIGSTLTLQLDVNTNGQSEAYAFDNILVTGLVSSFAEADFNEDGTVDGTDLAAWSANFGDTGASKSSGDADADGDVDGADFLVWQRQLDVTPIAASAGQVPEPSAMLLAAAGWLVVIGGGRRLVSNSTTRRATV